MPWMRTNDAHSWTRRLPNTVPPKNGERPRCPRAVSDHALVLTPALAVSQHRFERLQAELEVARNQAAAAVTAREEASALRDELDVLRPLQNEVTALKTAQDRLMQRLQEAGDAKAALKVGTVGLLSARGAVVDVLVGDVHRIVFCATRRWKQATLRC